MYMCCRYRVTPVHVCHTCNACIPGSTVQLYSSVLEYATTFKLAPHKGVNWIYCKSSTPRGTTVLQVNRTVTLTQSCQSHLYIPSNSNPHPSSSRSIVPTTGSRSGESFVLSQQGIKVYKDEPSGVHFPYNG